MPEITSELMVQSVIMVRAMEPYKSGNLRWNATYGINLGKGSFEIVVDGNVAPYIDNLDMVHYPGLFSNDIPAALRLMADSTLNDRTEAAIASTNQIADTAQNNPQRVELFNKALRSRNGQGGVA
jgi:hypothetical protein